jgi:hypothetical protein
MAIQTADRVLESVLAASATRTKGRGQVSPLYEWMEARREVLASAFEVQGSAGWTGIARALAAAKVFDGDGKAPTPKRCKRTWERVVAGAERRASARTPVTLAHRKLQVVAPKRSKVEVAHAVVHEFVESWEDVTPGAWREPAEYDSRSELETPKEKAGRLQRDAAHYLECLISEREEVKEYADGRKLTEAEQDCLDGIALTIEKVKEYRLQLDAFRNGRRDEPEIPKRVTTTEIARDRLSKIAQSFAPRRIGV